MIVAQELSVPISSISVLYNWQYQSIHTEIILIVFSAIPCFLISLGISTRGFPIRADFLYEVN